MKCRICAGKAIIGLPQHNGAYCEHFDNWMLKRVSKASMNSKCFLRKATFLLRSRAARTAWLYGILVRLGYNASGLYINLGIEEDDYSGESEEFARSFAERVGRKLYIVDIKKKIMECLYPKSLHEKAKTCSACGITKRYYEQDSQKGEL